MRIWLFAVAGFVAAAAVYRLVECGVCSLNPVHCSGVRNLIVAGVVAVMAWRGKGTTNV